MGKQGRLDYLHTLGDERDASGDGDQPLVGMLNVEKAATRLERRAYHIATLNMFVLHFFELVFCPPEREIQ